MNDAYSDRLREVTDFLKANNRYLVVGHVDPDPDSIGSTLALDWALRQLGKASIPVSPGRPLPNWSFLPGMERLRLPHEVALDAWDVLVVVDCEPDRTGPVADWVSHAQNVINIDHHATNRGTVPKKLINSDAAAAGEIIYDVIKEMGLPIATEPAVLLYTALMADTGSFRFSNTKAHVLQIAADLVAKGAEPHVISREIYDTRRWGYLKLLQRVLATLQRDEKGRVAWITLTAEALQEEGVRKEESEGLIQYPRMIEGVEVAILFREVGSTEVKVSFRSRDKVNVSVIAKRFGGGGHPRAAGCTLDLPLAQAQEQVLTQVHKAIADLGGGD